MKQSSLFFFACLSFIFLVATVPEINGNEPSLEHNRACNNKPLPTELPYERFIGLGNCCVSRYQINNHLSKRFNRDPKSFGGGQLFDWLIIHDYNKFCEALENNLTNFFERTDLVWGPSWNGSYTYPVIKNTRYDITWNHLFTREPSGFLPPNILEIEYAVKKQKIDYLTEKFKFLKHYRTLYIAAYPFIEPGELITKEPNKKAILRLRDALKKIRGNDNFTLLFCPLKQNFREFENVKVREIVNSQNPPYVGDYDFWYRMLSEFPFTLDKLENDNTNLDDIFK